MLNITYHGKYKVYNDHMVNPWVLPYAKKLKEQLYNQSFDKKHFL